MISSTKLYDLTELAEASYANLIIPSNLESELKNASFNSMSFSNIQAANFVSKWNVASHLGNTTNGFSATLFEDKTSPGNFTLAFRGTEPSDFANDIISADIGGIVIDGAALNQIVDLYNYWQRLTTATTAHYTQAEFVTSTSLPANGYIYAYQSPNFTYYISINHSTSSDFGLEKLSPTAKVDVTGHSLGGHLAEAFARLFPENTGDIVTANGAGFSGSYLDTFFNQLAGHTTTFAKANETANLFGEKGLEIITSDVFLNQFGERGAVAIESATHSVSAVTDSLAVFDLFIKLDATISTATPGAGLSQFKPIFEQASNQVEQSLEKLVEGLSGYILGYRGAPIVVDNREALYSAINDLTTLGGNFNNLIGKVTLAEPATSITEARSDFGAFLSLYHLTPFALKTLTQEAENLLKTINFDIASNWAHDKNLTPTQVTNGEQIITDNWLNDRIAMLSTMNNVNAEDSPATAADPYITQASQGKHFLDLAYNSEIFTGIQNDKTQQIIFGTDGANPNIIGQGGNDHLYGGGGADILIGNKGNDYLEGGTGSDIYVYATGDGFDTKTDFYIHSQKFVFVNGAIM